MADVTDGYDPWERERHIIARTRRVLADATADQLRVALAAGLDQATRLVQAYDRHDDWEWLFQRVRGATEVVEAIGVRLDG
jgi:hypothetical protein